MMMKLWVKFGTNNAVKVSTEGCQDVDDFLEACKKKFSPHFDSVATSRLSLSTSVGSPSLEPDYPISQITENSARSPLLISVAVAVAVAGPIVGSFHQDETNGRLLFIAILAKL